MKILLLGSGGREHAIAKKIAASPKTEKLYVLPGNAGMADIAELVPGKATDIDFVVKFAKDNNIDLTIVGPESPLIAGVVDALEAEGLKAFGPNKAAAQMEGSKVFAKEVMDVFGVPTAGYERFTDPDKADAYIDSLDTADPIVVKADGEAAGKGVTVAKTKAEAKEAVDNIMRKKAFGASGNSLIIEEFLDGQEASFMFFADGDDFVPMVPAQDHKRAYDGDKGPNTGGMGCYSPVPVMTPELQKEIIDTIIKPTLAGLKAKNIRYRGVLYCGLALTSKGPKVVEYNARFGDPETQVVLPLLETDLLEIMLAACDGKLGSLNVKWSDKKAVCVVMASGGYPGSYEKGKEITGIADAEKDGALVYHAGTSIKDGKLVTSGGRVLGVTALADSFEEAIKKAYEGVEKINFDGAFSRKDIGARVL